MFSALLCELMTNVTYLLKRTSHSVCIQPDQVKPIWALTSSGHGVGQGVQGQLIRVVIIPIVRQMHRMSTHNIVLVAHTELEIEIKPTGLISTRLKLFDTGRPPRVQQDAIRAGTSATSSDKKTVSTLEDKPLLLRTGSDLLKQDHIPTSEIIL